MKIRLNEIDSAGETFEYTDKSHELNEPLFKEFGHFPYSVSLSITGLDKNYLVAGQVQAELDEVCSRCGKESAIRVDFPINEILMVMDPDQRKDSYSRVNNFSEMSQTQQGVTELESEELEVAEFIYELIAIKRPDRPLCGGDTCTVYGEQPFEYDESMEESSNPFDVLKGLKN